MSGRFLIVAGVLLILAGLAVTYGGRFPIRLGRLPGDIAIHGKNSAFYFPLTTCILLSGVLSLVMWLLREMVANSLVGRGISSTRSAAPR